jgi:uncharacterized membrane protein (DUF106 family)
MIAVIMIMIGITLIVSSIIEWNTDIKRIKELENRLDEHYKEREKRLSDSLHSKDNDLIK